MPLTESTEKLLTVVCRVSDLDPLLAYVVALDDVKLLPLDTPQLPDGVTRLEPDAKPLKAYTEQTSLADRAIEYLLSYCTVHRTPTATPPTHGSLRLTPEKLKEAERIVREVLEIKLLLDGMGAEEENANKLIGMLAPWSTYSENVKVSETANTVIFYGTVPATYSLESLTPKDSLSDVLLINEVGGLKYVRVVCHSTCADRVHATLASCGFVRETFDAVSVSLKSTLINARKRLMQLEADRIRSDMTLAEYAEHLPELEAYRTVLAGKTAVEVSKSGFVYFDKYVCFRCRLSDSSALSAQTYLSHKPCAFELTDSPEADNSPKKHGRRERADK